MAIQGTVSGDGLQTVDTEKTMASTVSHLIIDGTWDKEKGGVRVEVKNPEGNGYQTIFGTNEPCSHPIRTPDFGVTYRVRAEGAGGAKVYFGP